MWRYMWCIKSVWFHQQTNTTNKANPNECIAGFLSNNLMREGGLLSLFITVNDLK